MKFLKLRIKYFVGYYERNDIVMTEQDRQVYNALQKWAERLNKWEYSIQVKRNKGKKLKTFSPNAFSLLLLENCRLLINEEITAEQAMSTLHTGEGRTQTRLCMEAGF